MRRCTIRCKATPVDCGPAQFGLLVSRPWSTRRAHLTVQSEAGSKSANTVCGTIAPATRTTEAERQIPYKLNASLRHTYLHLLFRFVSIHPCSFCERFQLSQISLAPLKPHPAAHHVRGFFSYQTAAGYVLHVHPSKAGT